MKKRPSGRFFLVSRPISEAIASAAGRSSNNIAHTAAVIGMSTPSFWAWPNTALAVFTPSAT